VTDSRRGERERRKAAREAALLEMLRRPLVQSALVGIGGFTLFNKLTRSGYIDTASGTFAAALCPVLAMANLGATDRYALLVVAALAAAANQDGIDADIKTGLATGVFPPLGLVRILQDGIARFKGEGP
jgi:hypothetical protein